MMALRPKLRALLALLAFSALSGPAPAQSEKVDLTINQTDGQTSTEKALEETLAVVKTRAFLDSAAEGSLTIHAVGGDWIDFSLKKHGTLLHYAAGPGDMDLLRAAIFDWPTPLSECVQNLRNVAQGLKFYQQDLNQGPPAHLEDLGPVDIQLQVPQTKVLAISTNEA